MDAASPHTAMAYGGIIGNGRGESCSPSRAGASAAAAAADRRQQEEPEHEDRCNPTPLSSHAAAASAIHGFVTPPTREYPEEYAKYQASIRLDADGLTMASPSSSGIKRKRVTEPSRENEDASDAFVDLGKPLPAAPKRKGSSDYLRKGQWTPTEERLARLLIEAFEEGYLPIYTGIRLRGYLAVQLQCDPMRVSKKLCAGSIDGKQIPKNYGQRKFRLRKKQLWDREEAGRIISTLERLTRELWNETAIAMPANLTLSSTRNADDDEVELLGAAMPVKKLSPPANKSKRQKEGVDSDATLGAASPPRHPSARRTTPTAVRSLLWKNWLLKKRHPIATLLEITLPCLYIVLVGLTKGQTANMTVPAGWSDTSPTDGSRGTSHNVFEASGSSFPASAPLFYSTEVTLTGIILSLGGESIDDGLQLDELAPADLSACKTGVMVRGAIGTDPSSPYRVPDECANKVSPYKIAIAPDNTFTREYFMQTMDQWYPRIKLLNGTGVVPEIPSLRQSVVFYKTVKDLEDYIASNKYGDGRKNPRIYGGIVFDKLPSDDEIGQFTSIEYTLRFNSTSGRDASRFVPRTNGDPPAISPFQRKINVDDYPRYATSGFMTLQTLVTRFVTCMPEWNATTKKTTGRCQRPQTTAPSSSDIDKQLLTSLDKDVQLQIALPTLWSSEQNANQDGPSSSSDGRGSAKNASSIALSTVIARGDPSVQEALLKPLRQVPQAYLGGAVAPFPIESYVSSRFYGDVKEDFALIFILAYLYCVSRILVVLIQEKESRLREYMKILGVKENAIIVSWYITYGAILLVGAILQALAGLVGLFANSSVLIVFLFFFLFGLSVLAFGFLVSTIFSKARVGVLSGLVLFFMMYFGSFVFTPQTSERSKSIGCLLPPVALAQGVRVLATLESTGQGIAFANISVLSENFRFSTALLFFLVDTVLYTLLGLYFENALPKEYGTTLKWYFPVSPSYWRGRRLQKAARTNSDDDVVLGEDSPRAVGLILDVNPNVEPVGADLHEQERNGDVLSIQRLRKVFPVPGGEKVAVKGLNLVMYKDQITCLLGHNGAGKTTLISMLTGMIAPSSGTASFQGLTITHDMDEIRESLGICFQHDVLFADLTVEEHLLLFGQIKGYAKEELRAVVDCQIQEVGLNEKCNVLSSALSGGMKRKLSVAVSLLGDSSLVFLDEPTSGMDPYSRRSTRELLLNNRHGRVMVLTTHFMDEADILGDRIAIMAEGGLRCCGSSLFLKNKYGAGYNLTLVKDDRVCNDSDVINFISTYVPNAQVLSNVGSELAFQLPLESSRAFATMFGDLDSRLSDLGLLSYGVSVTTLEEVFIKVAEATDADDQSKNARVEHSLVDNPVVASPTNDSARTTKTGLFFAQLQALFLKRLRVAKRDRTMLVFSTFLPVLLLLAGLMLLDISSIRKNDPKLPLTTDAYGLKDKSPTPFYCQADEHKWCSAILSGNTFTGALPEQLTSDVIKSPSYDSDTPHVFGVTYTSPKINASGATRFGLRLGEEMYKRGYGKNGKAVESQYGAYLMYGESSRHLVAYNVFLNTSSTHGAPLFKALLDQAIYRFFAANVSGSSAPVQLKVSSHPLPLTALSKAVFGSFIWFSACIFIVIAFTFFPASIVVFLVREKQSEHNAKHQQLVSGVSLGAFWLSNYLWDLLTYIVPFAAAVILIKAFGIPSLTGNGCVTCTESTFVSVIVLFFCFGLAICPFTYCLSYLFREHASSQMYTIMINFVIGVALLVVSFKLDSAESTKDVNAVLVFIWRLSPLFNLGNGLLRLTMNEMTSVLNGDKEKKSSFSTDLMGYELVFLLLSAVVFSSAVVGIDYALTFPNVKKNLMSGASSVDEEAFDEDVDVRNEAQRVQDGAFDDVVVLKNLRKVYPGGPVAVCNLSFGLKRGECFGFLGINGAGKTSTMKMLTGDVLPSSGTATLGGFDILTQQIQVRRQIGYCPQFDALFELLTVREHLELFARIKGVSRADLVDVVTEKIHQLNLEAFENKLAGSLSGGNKRKLSVAIAMIGDPRIIFLDEPSTGMDPVSRRFMWDVIAGISTRSKSATIVLTTHSMEESEALCSRVGIMVLDVKMSAPQPHEHEEVMERIFGQHSGTVTANDLDDKCQSFGNASLASRIEPGHPTGYSLAAAMDRDGFIRAEAFAAWCMEETRFDELDGFLRRSFGDVNVQIMERHNDFCRFKLRDSNDQLKLSKVFALVEDIKTRMHIRQYSVSQTTLEQIFNNFAAQQGEEKTVVRGMNVASEYQ
ncbi:hypothetical protein P43SY_006549 [Pythium insidiosum]|uniref:ABC transporter domain-containing protein n=1 Tax=Pythium insidiosum TaxID=114742 RepID=A0AAD5Q4Q4_PYTIN|nr:hypothetical protein P43SY_006549 [Pythium insidiosum]